VTRPPCAGSSAPEANTTCKCRHLLERNNLGSKMALKIGSATRSGLERNLFALPLNTLSGSLGHAPSIRPGMLLTTG
jgi:hypothetical protein